MSKVAKKENRLLKNLLLVLQVGNQSRGPKSRGNKFLRYGPSANCPPARTPAMRVFPMPAQAVIRRLRHSAEEFIPTAFTSTALWPATSGFLFVLLLAVGMVSGAYAQNDVTSAASKPKIGEVNVDFQKAALTPGVWHLMGGAKITSADYDLTAEDIKITFNPSSGKPSAAKRSAAVLERAVAAGTPTKQVVAHLRRPLDSQEYTIYADQAIYVPVATRPSGGKMDFTGHVKVITASGFLAEPSVSTFESATVLLGAGSEYPQVNTGAGHITLTPAQ